MRTRLDQLLNYHQQLLEQALLLGSRPGNEQRARVAAGFQDGLGSPAAALRDLLQELTAPPTES